MKTTTGIIRDVNSGQTVAWLMNKYNICRTILMQYSYEKNLPLLEKKLRKINITGENMFKYNSIIFR